MMNIPSISSETTVELFKIFKELTVWFQGTKQIAGYIKAFRDKA